MIKNITCLGHTGLFDNCLGTLASQHCKNTLFKMGIQNLGCYNEPLLESHARDDHMGNMERKEPTHLQERKPSGRET
jgi:hypothetical protein